MYRRIELAAALLASALGLIWIAYEASTLQSLWVLGVLNGSGAGPAPRQPISTTGTGLFFAVAAAIMVCVALGAYLHAVQRFIFGITLVWMAAILDTVVIGFFLIEPWHFVPAQFIYIVQAASFPWLTPLGVLSVVFAWVTALAGLPVRRLLAPGHASRVPAGRPQGPEPLATVH